MVYASFLLRLWREEEQEAGRERAFTDWHSQVEHIQSGQKWEFDTLSDLLSFFNRLGGNEDAWRFLSQSPEEDQEIE